MKSDNPKTCMTDGSPIEPDHREINPKTGMQKGYVVLCPEERAKGFIRPVRQTYVHVGRVVCGKIRRDEAYEREGKVWVCVLSPGHEGECSHWATVPIDNAAKVEATHQLG